jgi:hypothetical protein
MKLNTQSRSARVLLAGVLTAGLSLSAGLAGGTAASAAANSFIATPNGMVGVSQNIVIQAPKLKNQAVVIGFSLGSYGSTAQTVINAQGFGNLSWTPPTAGTWTVSGLGNAASLPADTISVAAMPTETVLIVPNQVQQGYNSNILAVVTAPIGNAAPTGTVTVRSASSSNVIGTGTLSAQPGTSISTATIPWTPAGNGAFAMQGTFNPSDAGFVTSVSPISQPNIGQNVVTVALRFPPVLNVGDATLLSSVLGQGMAEGVVSYTFDEQGITGSLPTANGVNNISWAPPTPGVHYIKVYYSGNPPLNQSGSNTQAVNILPAIPTDTVSINQQGVGAWNVGRPISVTAGQPVILSGSATSGSPVLLSESGPCVIDGAALTGLSAGTCTVTATSTGNVSYNSGTITYSVTVVNPPKKKKKSN